MNAMCPYSHTCSLAEEWPFYLALGLNYMKTHIIALRYSTFSEYVKSFILCPPVILLKIGMCTTSWLLPRRKEDVYLELKCSSCFAVFELCVFPPRVSFFSDILKEMYYSDTFFGVFLSGYCLPNEPWISASIVLQL